MFKNVPTTVRYDKFVQARYFCRVDKSWKGRETPRVIRIQSCINVLTKLRLYDGCVAVAFTDCILQSVEAI